MLFLLCPGFLKNWAGTEASSMVKEMFDHVQEGDKHKLGIHNSFVSDVELYNEATGEVTTDTDNSSGKTYTATPIFVQS